MPWQIINKSGKKVFCGDSERLAGLQPAGAALRASSARRSLLSA
jgi:hypothetical protein